MARQRGKDAIYAAADAFRTRCLINEESLLWPETVAWTSENLASIWEATIEGGDPGGADFFDKWEKQLEGSPVPVHRIAADVTALYHLYPRNFRQQTKLSRIERVISWQIRAEPADLETVELAFEHNGIGHGGTYYATNPYLQYAFFHKFAEEILRRDCDPHSPEECKRVALEVDEKLMPQRAVAARHIVLHLLFPEQFERIASDNHRKQILTTFQDLAGDYSDEYEALSHVREGLARQIGRTDFDFYDKDLRCQWDPEWEKGRLEEGKSEEQQIPQVWIEKTLVEGRPDRQQGDFALGKALWSPQADRRGADIYHFMRKVRRGDIVLHLTDNEAITGMSRVASECEEFDGVPGTEWGTGPSYVVELDSFRELDPPLSREVLFSGSCWDALSQLASEGHKNLFYNSRAELNQGAYLTPVTGELLGVLDGAYEGITGEKLTSQIPELEDTGTRHVDRTRDLSLDWLHERTLWPRSRLLELVEDLEADSPQVVLAGPPGTSKTWVAKHVARYLTEDRDSRHRIVQFHPSYGYEDFIEGLRPVSKDGTISFSEQPGVLLQMVGKMRERDAEDETHVLVIDEMNRANLPRVFGELMYLFEYRGDGEEIQLQYTKSFSLPPGLRFIGTMNTADRSIRSIDIALRRRFDVFECWPESKILEQFYRRDDNSNEVEDLVEGFERLNEQLTEHLDRHHTIGHTFFMHRRMDWVRLKKTWNRKIGPLIEEYFFDQPDIAAEYTLEEFWSAP